MGTFIARQPNGLLCRFSEVVDTVTHYNMTDEEFVEFMADEARKEARYWLKHERTYFRPYSEVKESFIPNNMSQKIFKSICRAMEREPKRERLWGKPRLKTTKTAVAYDYADGHGEIRVEEQTCFHCPKCDGIVGEYFEPRCHAQRKSKYCPDCGQKIDWSDWTYEEEKKRRKGQGTNEKED